ncbi:MAG TPA: class I SAM-dependent methyltransferase [Jatrophihabitans sp.]|nr:class I SAM-dependent methyltransferase [Jatrophihabitans sp.]
MSVRARLFAALYDRQMHRVEAAGLGALRERLLGRAGGRVLEIGSGTGANLRLLAPGAESLTVTEPEAPMLSRLERRVQQEAPAATVHRVSAEELPFADQSFDVVVSTLVLCGVGDQPRALAEVRRVLRPGGRLLFLEHVRSTDLQVARAQDALNPVNRFFVRCNCNRATVEAIEHAGFAIESVERLAMPKAPFFIRPIALGTAARPAA